MNLDIPSNLIIWIVGSVVTATFGTRAYLNYRRINSPLSKYFSVTGYLVSMAWILWVLPFIIFNLDEPTGRYSALILISLGDALLFTAMFTQSYIYWYLALQNTVKYVYLAVPSAIIALGGLASSIYAGFSSLDLPRVADGKAIFPSVSGSHISQLILIVFVFLIGIELLKRAARQEGRKSKSGSIAISLLYICVGLGGSVNILSSSEATNTSPVVVVLYAIGLASFTLIFLVFRILEIKK